MQVTAGELYAAKDALFKLGEMKVSFDKAYRISKFIKKASNELDIIEKKKNEIIVTVGILTEDGMGTYSIPKEKQKEYADQLNELGKVQIEIESDKINFKDLNRNADGTETLISANELILLEPFIEFNDKSE